MHDLIDHSHINGSPYLHDDCAVERVCRTGTGCRLDDDCFWRKDHSVFSVEMDARLIYESGRMTGTFVTFTDITERKHTELTLATATVILKERNAELLETGDQALAATKSKSDFLASMSHESGRR